MITLGAFAVGVIVGVVVGILVGRKNKKGVENLINQGKDKFGSL